MASARARTRLHSGQAPSLTRLGWEPLLMRSMNVSATGRHEEAAYRIIGIVALALCLGSIRLFKGKSKNLKSVKGSQWIRLIEEETYPDGEAA